MTAVGPTGAGTARRAPEVLRTLARLGRAPRRRLVLAALLGVAGALATVGLLAGSGYVVDRAAFRPGLGAIAGILAGVEVLAFLRGPLRYAERLMAHDAAFRALGRWRVWLFDRLEPLSPAALGTWRTGDLLTRAVDDVDTLQDLYLRGAVPVAVAFGAGALGVVVVGLLLPAAAVVLGAALLVALVVPAAVATAARPGRGREAALRGELAADIVDLLHGAADLLAFGQEDLLLARAAGIDEELRRLARKRAWTAGLGSALVTVCLGGAVVGVLALAVAAVAAHRLDPVMLAVLPLAAVGAFEPVPAVVAAAVRTGDVVDAGRRLLDLADVAVPVVDPEVALPVPAGVPAIEFDHARLRYGPDRPWALDDASLALDPGSRTAVVGSSGAGKSSLVNVLLRFWPLAAGEARLGGHPIDRYAQADVRRAVALVDQDARLFAGSIRRNVTLGRPDAGEEEVAAALRLAQLDGWVRSLPEGLETAVGEGGAKVSGGQRQRLALARALLTGAPVLVLDEPTTGLDRATAEQLLADVLGATRTTGPGRTVVLVTHHPAETAGFDQVAVMEAGRVTEVRHPGRPDAPGRQPDCT
jgi:ATP-binding cassette subfamily C protein CydC